QGKRLLEIKAKFGKILSQCKKEVYTVLRQLRRGQLQDGLDVFCRIHNTCVQSTKADMALEIFDCWNLALINKAYLHYVSEDVSPEQSQAIGDILACLRNTEGATFPAHVVDDLLAFWNQYVRTVG
ncbi:hypothetical protein V5799_007640, partial [Amblyomma americanum]